MFNPKVLKLVAHTATMLIGSVLIGTLVKAEKEAHQRINDHFETNTEDSDN